MLSPSVKRFTVALDSAALKSAISAVEALQ